MNDIEINRLRKSGRLDEAMAEAEKLFAERPDKFSAGALFWCLKDKCRKQQGQEVEDTYNRMLQIYKDFGQGNEYMQKTMGSIDRRLTPNRDLVQSASEKAKAGDKRVFRPIEQLYIDGKLDPRLYPDYGWIIYFTLKHVPDSEIGAYKHLLIRYFDLDPERPSQLHSLILAEALKLKQAAPQQIRIRDFARLWGLENLRAEDWEQYKTTEGNTLPSLAEKLVNAYAKELRTDHAAPAEGFDKLMDEALRRYPSSQNLPYSKALLLIAQGEQDEAIKYYKELIIRFPGKFYLWDQLADLTSDPEVKIGLLCKAVNTGDDEGFIGGVRMRLAEALIAKGLLSNAKTELEKYRQTYESRGWHVKYEFQNLANRVPVDVPPADNSALYAEYSPRAEEFIYSELPTVYAVKVAERKIDDNRHPGRKYLQWTLRSGNQVLRLKRPQKLGLVPRTANGTVFEVKINDGKIVWIRQTESVPALDWLRTVSGIVTKRLDRNGNPYAIIDHVYIPGDLLQGVNDGETVRVVALCQDDGKWKAVQRL